MVNTFAVNEYEVNHWFAPISVGQDDIVFQGYSLQNANIITDQPNNDDLTDMEMNTSMFPRNDGAALLSRYYRGRTISIRSTLLADNETELNELIDEVKKNLRETEGNLDIKVNGVIRRIKATATNINFKREHFHLTWCPLEVTFKILEPFFYETADQTANFANISADFDAEITHKWTAKSFPVFYFFFWAGTSMSALEYADSMTTFTVTHAFTNGDVLIIDWEEKTVTLNGTEIDYNGRFPEFSPGLNLFSMDFTGTVLVDIATAIKKTFL